MRKSNLLCCLLLLFVVSCSLYDNESESLLRRAEELMVERPDSALCVLNGVGDKWKTLAKVGRMRYLLLRTEALNKTCAALDTIDYMGEVLDYYKRCGSAAERTRAYYMMGSVYRDLGNFPQALIYFCAAVNQTSEMDKDRDYALLSRIYSQMALLFGEQRYPQQEVPMWKMAYKYAMLANDTVKAIQTIVGKCSAYWTLDEKDSAMLMARRCIEEYRKIGRNDYAAGAMLIPMFYYLERDSLEEAGQAIDEYIRYSGSVSDDLKPILRNELFYFALGRYYEKTGRSDSAIYFYRRLLEYDDDIQNIENGYLGLMSVYQKECKADSVFKYAKLYAAANDSANHLNLAGEIIRTQALYNLNESQRVAMNKTIEAARLKLIICLIVAAVLVIGVTIYYFISARLKREKEERLKINKEYAKAITLYENAHKELDLLRTNTVDAIKNKEREIEMLQRTITSYQENSNIGQWDIEHSLLASDIVKRMRRHASCAKAPSVSERSDLMSIVETLCPNFYTIIHESKKVLTNKEIKVYILTRLNFIPTEIATLMNLSKQRISNIRANINRKLFNEASSKGLDTNMRKP